MPLLQKIEDDYKVAFKAHQDAKVNVLRMVKAAIKNAEIQARHTLNDDEIIAVMTKEAKRRREAIAMYQQANRQDLVTSENAELQELMYYLPTEMSDSELDQVVTGVIAELKPTPKDFGKVMSAVMAKVKGQADGSRVSARVKANLH